jgi:hypothetical protein
MSGWTIPPSFEAFQAEANADGNLLYRNICTFIHQTVANTNQQLADAHDEITGLEAEVTSLRTQLAIAQQAPPPHRQSENPPASTTQRSEKIPDPDKFDGTRTKTPDFLTQIRLKLRGNRDRFLDEQGMMMYVVSRLEGAALRQIATFVTEERVNFDSTVALLEYMETSFGDPDTIGTARRELHELKQKTDFSAYLTEFRRIMGKLRYDEAAQMDALELGLSGKLKDALVFTTRPATMAEYEKQLLVLDNKIKARDEEKKGTKTHMGQFTAGTPPTGTHSSLTPGGLAPMDLSATQWQNQNTTPRPPINLRHEVINGIKKTTPAEKAWRRANGRCDFCGEAGHAYMSCPKKQTRPRYTMHGAATNIQPNNPFAHAFVNPPPAPQNPPPAPPLADFQ